MLLTAKQMGCRIEEIPIQTVYEPGNRSSHFNPLLDSMKIYFVLLRFSSASVLTAVLDNSVFYLVWKKTGRILESQAIGRFVAVAFNYFVVRRAVFQTHQQHRDVLWRYLLLVVVSGAVSYLLIRGLTAIFPIPVPWAKIGVESAIFFANFYIQRRLIFNRSTA
jgi:putative flippase GtrA